MIELWAAVRDNVGLHSTLVYNRKPVLIKDLPAGSYDLKHNEVIIGKSLGPNQIPGYLMDYCTQLEKKGLTLEGENHAEIISRLQIIIDSVTPVGAVECAKVISDYSAKQKPFPEGAIEAARVLRESSVRREQTVEAKVV